MSKTSPRDRSSSEDSLTSLFPVSFPFPFCPWPLLFPGVDALPPGGVLAESVDVVVGVAVAATTGAAVGDGVAMVGAGVASGAEKSTDVTNRD